MSTTTSQSNISMLIEKGISIRVRVVTDALKVSMVFFKDF